MGKIPFKVVVNFEVFQVIRLPGHVQPFNLEAGAMGGRRPRRRSHAAEDTGVPQHGVRKQSSDGWEITRLLLPALRLRYRWRRDAGNRCRF